MFRPWDIVGRGKARDEEKHPFRRFRFQTMSSAKKRISIYDYPEHLNPFSENHSTVPDKRKMNVDIFRKNGTWSSKISKRLNRSVSWMEKSWFGIEDSPRRNFENGICNDLKNNVLYVKQSQAHNLMRRESCSDVRNDAEMDTSDKHRLKINGNALKKSISIENMNKFEIKKRKKRPAPAPPSNEVTSPEIEKAEPSNIKISQSSIENELPVSSNINRSISLAENIITEKEEQEENLVSKTKVEDCPNEQIPSQTCELVISLDKDVQNLSITNDETLNSTESVENIKNPEESDSTIEKICEKKQIDENANITLVKNENEEIVKIECNGKPKMHKCPEKDV